MGESHPAARGIIGGIGQSSVESQEGALKRKEQEAERKAEEERIEAERARFGGGGGVSLLPDSSSQSLG